jgi:hypothetical protein
MIFQFGTKKEVAMRFFESIRRNHNFHFFLLFLAAATIVLSDFGCSSKETAQMQKPHAPSDGPEFAGNPHPHQTGDPISDETFIASRLSATKVSGRMRRGCRKE